ncbi:MAG: excinuclease ABC subunit UvrC [Candidatus Nitrospinota bacterium M3_3B_026]
MAGKFEHLKETLESAPTEPGVYLMKGADGRILYVGKAKVLRERVRSYFQDSAVHSPRIAVMVGKVRSIDFMTTSSELEALILEDNIIKKEKPPFNVMLRDDKNYPYLKLTMDETYPRLLLVRRALRDGGLYFGPYVSGKSVRDVMRLIHRIFPLRQSKDNLDGKPPRRPCLNYQMGRCLAPCAGKTTPEEYRGMVDDVILFLKGKDTELVKDLERRMKEAAEREFFELAARYRDQIAAVERLKERQAITDTRLADEDFIASHEAGGRSVIKILQARRGKVSAGREFLFDNLERLDRAEALGAFIRQFYREGMEIPPAIVVNEAPEGMKALEEALSARRGGRVRITVPARGRRKRLIEMAERNARLRLEAVLDSAEMKERALEQVRDGLGLPGPPRSIEAYDISTTGGLASVGVVVTFKNGEPDKSGYRKYKITSAAGPDDYAALAEVVERRHRRLLEEGAPFADLLVIDGGKGQVSAVAARFMEMGIERPPAIVGIAKGKDRENPDTDEFYLPGKPRPVDIPPSSPGRLLLQRARDEAHRSAISYHRKARGAEAKRSALDSIAGVGPKRKKQLLRKFGSVKRIREASVEELREALSVSEEMAKRILESL